jgi:hypothetical protein
MSGFWTGIVTGVLSSLLVAVFLPLMLRECHRRQNCAQWVRIKKCLGHPSALRAVSGGGSLVIGINTTPWTVAIEVTIELPIDEHGGRGYRLEEQSWKPNAGLSWQISSEVKRMLDDRNSKVYANIAYEPIHKNIGSVNEVAVGERVNLHYLDFSPERGEAGDAQS